VRSLRWTNEAGATRIEFELPRGSFATAVLHELLCDAWSQDAGGED
jgi:tRNA(Glu) U13 pseudouridine synthase TruD